MIDEDLLNAIADRDDDEHPAIARLLEFGTAEDLRYD